MNSIERACLSRVRMLALVAMTRAGGTPARWQLRRAIDPILGDLLEELPAVGDRSGPGAPSRSRRLPTVDTIATKSPKSKARRDAGKTCDRDPLPWT